MDDSSKLDTILPHTAPVCGDARILLFTIRRMAIHGLHDAFAANAMLAGYGMRYRKPLVLLRALLVDIARTARGNIIVAPCCTPRMTAHEFALLSAICDPEIGKDLIHPLLKPHRATSAVPTITALNETLGEMGRPLAI
ncbi:DUF6628 family protein [Parasphingopyxis lamellibrachiae]|uniref:Uncharacterized protein n=1 Tax=Parasphingopyxis lamellibrachiae TaxID=680125 RepID=A0A3D9FDG6_9SPHN|nr:DUF6628 family protein [Parasphingopyxis lamellibrachiae]RED15708.1 hypothetical protein DFR46_0711 [Parasphingopyxis lamellibrachiae]